MPPNRIAFFTLGLVVGILLMMLVAQVQTEPVPQLFSSITDLNTRVGVAEFNIETLELRIKELHPED